jgi:predicted CXXCH cytochrome family protein
LPFFREEVYAHPELVLVICFVVIAAAVPFLSTKLAAKSEPETSALPPQDLSQYIGNESCAECHDNQATHYKLTAHSKTNNEKFRANQRGCEACHGGAKLHVEFYTTAQKLMKEGKDAEAQAMYSDETKAKAAALRSFSELSPKEASAVCLTCHKGTQGKSEERFNFRRSEHARHGVSCLDCHSSHSPKRTEFLLRETQPNMCYQCHADQKATLQRFRFVCSGTI